MKRFVHRENQDGTWDSICSVCLKTVAMSMRTEAILATAEVPHICDPVELSRLEAIRIQAHLKKPN